MKSRKYQEIHDALASEIQKGVYDADGTLPGENVIAGRFSTARETVRKALAMLFKPAEVAGEKFVSPQYRISC